MFNMKYAVAYAVLSSLQFSFTALYIILLTESLSVTILFVLSRMRSPTP